MALINMNKYVYRGTSAVDRANYKIQAYKDVFGKESPEYRRLEIMLEAVPSEFKRGDKIVKPSRAIKNDEAWEMIEVINKFPSVSEIKRTRDKMRKEEAKEGGYEYQKETWKEFKQAMKFNTRVQSLFNRLYPEFYNYLDGAKNFIYEPSKNQLADEIMEYHDLWKAETDTERKNEYARGLLLGLESWRVKR